MLRVWKSVLAGVAALTACMAAGEAAAGVLPPGEHNKMVRAADHRPMAFFVAKGPADSCGKGCNEWIAAVGLFDIGAQQRFQDLLAKLGGRNLPIFFNSPGGLAQAGIHVGAIMRERRMTAGVGRTETRCRVFDKKDADCQQKIKTGEPVVARLMTTNAQCMSACVYAFAGASSRHIAPGAVMGVHSPRQVSQKQSMVLLGTKNVEPNKVSKADILEVSRRYYLDMGIHPDLPDLAAKTSPERIYALDRNEITRFGLETRGDSFETPWITSDIPDSKFAVTKAVTRRTASNPAEYLTLRFLLWCSSDGHAFVGYRRELPLDPDQVTSFVRATFDNSFLNFTSFNSRSGVETGGSASPLYDETINRIAAAKNLTLTETMKNAGHEILETKFSNAGFGSALGEFRKRCVPGFLQRTPPVIPNIPAAKRSS